jgi:hypothetical protein
VWHVSPSEDDELVSQHEHLDVLSEFAASAVDQQPQHGREGEIGERKEHAPMLASHRGLFMRRQP